ncbi:phytoene/squalene synthase family protein [Haloquadratum walsbyi]|jgi:phytoene synthase (EC 2.5.1.32)|uniref:Phytoene/squalene synthetase n=1 Tax=Haloquadratum walsbyi J07HQW2 TaxID=1238425 RepID=U1PMV4_9EURY|nr:phytoene/squalene synthase family protein [Haloquadratum walsbyi]ERG95072.1 MAG: phytoene/squalene synthetase [Haloquadratum walsbyi J07HQW2]
MVRHEQIERSKTIQKRTGKTFHLATRVLPERVRHATYVLYAFFRVADEVVDAADAAPPPQQRERLAELRRQALGEESTDDPVLSAFAELCERYNIPNEDVNVFIDAMLADVDTDQYETYDDLEAYMDGSAAAVGRMMTAIMDTDDAETALPHATALGEAFQMSNFLRDVGEDVKERNRVYLPQETLRQYDVSTSQILNLEFDDSVRAVIQHEQQRTEALYREGVKGIQYLPEDCQFAVLLAAVLYADHHRAIERADYDVLSRTPSLSTPRKIWLLLKTRVHWAITPDPVSVFQKVSVVPYPDEHEDIDEADPDARRDRERSRGWSIGTEFVTQRFSSLVRHFTRGE